MAGRAGRRGRWTPCQYYDGTLAALASDVDALDVVTPLDGLALVGPGGRRLRDAFVNPLGGHPAPDYAVVWTHETNAQKTMKSFADFNTEPKPARREYATTVLWPKASKLLIACKVRASSVRVAAIHLPQAALGQPFIPVTPLPHIRAAASTLSRAWCAYLNPTPATLSFLNRRQKTPDYSDYSLEQLRSMPVPDPAKCDLGGTELLPWPQWMSAPARCSRRRSTGAQPRRREDRQLAGADCPRTYGLQ